MIFLFDLLLLINLGVAYQIGRGARTIARPLK